MAAECVANTDNLSCQYLSPNVSYETRIWIVNAFKPITQNKMLLKFCADFLTVPEMCVLAEKLWHNLNQINEMLQNLKFTNLIQV